MKDIIEKIADCLVEDHVALMNKNKELREALSELLEEYHPRECWTDEHIEYELSEGNMVANVVKRAYKALGG